MPAILVASKMKSGLPKPVHSAIPIQHLPARTPAPPSYLKLGSKLEVCKSTYSSQIPMKSPHGHDSDGDGTLHRASHVLDNGIDPQLMSKWCSLCGAGLDDKDPGIQADAGYSTFEVSQYFNFSALSQSTSLL
ncbi:NAV2 protein, partial [Polypterus senegalus]|nr:NAV2 protein [Polypterus senegalus]